MERHRFGTEKVHTIWNKDTRVSFSSPYTTPSRNVGSKTQALFLFCVCEQKRKTFHKDEISKAFKRVCKRVRIEDLRFHGLRHTFATRLAHKGADPYIIQRLLGHKPPYTMQRYAHHCIESLRGAIALLKRFTGTKLSHSTGL
jgi:integrase